MTNLNKIQDEIKVSKTGQRPVRVTLTLEDTGEVVYSHVSKGGALVNCEDLRMEAFGTLDGKQQITLWGNPMSWFYAFDQLRQKLEGAETRDLIIAAMEKANVSRLAGEFYARQSDSMRRANTRPEVMGDVVVIVPYMKGTEMDGFVSGFKEKAGRDLVLACGHGLRADIFDDGDRFVCPFIVSVAPGSGKLDRFLVELQSKLDKPLVFTNFTNERLRQHLLRCGIECE